MTLNGTGVYTLNGTGFYNRPWDDRGGDVSRISPTECTHLSAFLPPSSMHAQSRCCIISAGLCHQQWRCKCCRPLLANVPGSLRSLLAFDNSTLHAACSLQHTDGLAVAHALPGVACTNMRFPLLYLITKHCQSTCLSLLGLSSVFPLLLCRSVAAKRNDKSQFRDAVGSSQSASHGTSLQGKGSSQVPTEGSRFHALPEAHNFCS